MEIYYFKGLKKDIGKLSHVNGKIVSSSGKPFADIQIKDNRGEIYNGIIKKPQEIFSAPVGHAVSNLGNGVNIHGNIDFNSKSGSLYIKDILDKNDLKKLALKPGYSAVIVGAVTYDDLGKEKSRVGEIPE